MTEIKIIKGITPNKLKDLYNKYVNQQDLGNITLVIPGEIAKYSFGLLADLLKFVININSKHSIINLKVDLDKETLDSLYDQEYAYPIIALLWNTCSFSDKDGNDIKNLLRKQQNTFFLKMNSLAKIKGNKYTLTNADHLSESKGLIRFLENSNGFIDDEEKICEKVGKILSEYVLTFNKNNISEIEDITGDIGAIIFELAKNTHEWGKSDANSVDIPSSIRGVYLRFHINKNEKLLEEYNNTPLSTFFNNPSLKRQCLNELGQIYYLEISVFDSGVGFIDKFNPKQTLTDIEIIKKCLIKNQTSSISNLKSKKGIGLDRILNILNGKGFLKISTDKYSAYRDLLKDGYKPIDKDNLKDLILQDWDNNNFNSENLLKSQGSYISILYPFKHQK